VLLAFRPFAMCLKMMRYYSPVEESFLAVFIRVWCRSVVSYNGLTAGAVADSKERKFIL